MYILGYVAGSASIPMFIAIISAVLTLDSDAPNAFGRYVTRMSIGVILVFIQFLEGGTSVSFMSSMHSVAVAVMMGSWLCSFGGVSPPSTAKNRGDGDCRIRAAICVSSGLMCVLVYGSRLRVPAALNLWISALTSHGVGTFSGGFSKQWNVKFVLVRGFTSVGVRVHSK